MQRFHTRSDTDLKRWREEIGRAVLNLDVEPIGERPFHSVMAPRLEHEGVRIVHWRHTPALTIRDRHMVKDGEAAYTLIYPRAGPLEILHLGREILLRPGEAVLMQNGEPGLVGSPRGCDFVAILLAEHLLPTAVGARALARISPRTDRGLALLRGYVDALAPLPGLSTPLAEAAARHVAELASLVLKSDGDANRTLDPGCIDHAARLSMALHFIATNFRDPGLDEHKVAAHQGISVRQLQRLMERSGLSFVRHVNQLRLQSAHAALCDPAQSQRRVLDIALASGFSDVSHFNRLFKRAYDASPTAVRSRRPS